ASPRARASHWRAAQGLARLGGGVARAERARQTLESGERVVARQRAGQLALGTGIEASAASASSCGAHFYGAELALKVRGAELDARHGHAGITVIAVLVLVRAGGVANGCHAAE